MKPTFKVVPRVVGIAPTETTFYDMIYVDETGQEKIVIQNISGVESMATVLCNTMNEGLELGWDYEAIMELYKTGIHAGKIFSGVMTKIKTSD